MLFDKLLQPEISYNDVIELDGAFATTHINYGKSPIFSGIDGSTIAIKSRSNSMSTKIEEMIRKSMKEMMKKMNTELNGDVEVNSEVEMF